VKIWGIPIKIAFIEIPNIYNDKWYGHGCPYSANVSGAIALASSKGTTSVKAKDGKHS
jgi:hypothetical protein